jgi:RNA polymerase sigma factor (sigma-70 family)
MSDGTTTLVLQSLLDRLRLKPDDAQVRKELIARSYERLAAVAHRLLGPAYRDRPEDTSGLLAEAYIRLEKSLAAVKPESVRQYLGLAALQMRRALIDLIRKERGRSGKHETPVSLNLGATIGGGMGNAPAAPQSEDHDWRLELMAAMERLDEGEREVVDLLYFNDLTQFEAAGLLGVDESTVKRRWARARVRLAKWLHAFGPEDAASPVA